MRDFRRKLIFSLILLLIIITFGTIGYMVIEGWGFMDSLFMTIITITTVGYGEVHDLSRPGEIFTIILLISGVGVILYVLSSEARIIIEGELQYILGRKRLENRIKNLKNHYIVCGFGRMGKIISEELKKKGVELVVIDKNPDAFTDAADVLSLEADATKDETLNLAGIENAKGLVSVLSSDAENLFVVLSARELNPDIFIVSRTIDESSQKKFINAGANRVVSPYHTGGVKIANLILKPAIVDFLELATKGENVELELEEVIVNENSGFIGTTLGESNIGKELGIIVLAIKKHSGTMKFNPTAKTTIENGDTLIAIGERSKLKLLENRAHRK